MASNIPLHQQAMNMKQAIFDEGLLDEERFIQLEELEHEDINPDFIDNVFTIFLGESTKYIAEMENAMNKSPPDAFTLERTLYKLKGASANIGAHKIRNEVNQMREKCNEGNFESAKVYFEQLKMEQAALKTKFTSYLEVMRQVKLGGDVPPPN